MARHRDPVVRAAWWSRVRDSQNKKRREAYHKNAKHYIAKAKVGRLRAVYGLSSEAFARMLTEQGGVCAICKKPPIGKYGVLYVDHDHGTDAVRALLCKSCNHGIGCLLDDSALCRAAADYLDSHGAIPKPRPEATKANADEPLFMEV